MLQPVHLRTLKEVLSTGSLSSAGARLGFTASAVSQQIAGLERSTGLTLFERGPRSVRPTAAAHALAHRAEALLNLLDLLEREVRVMAAGKQGAVRIGSFPSASANLLPLALARLDQTHSDIDVLLDEAEPAELLPRLLDSSLDVILVYEYDVVPQFWPGILDKTVLLHESLLVLLPRGHRLIQQPTIDLADLAEDRWASSLEGTAGARTLNQLCAASNFKPRVDYRSNDYNVLRGLVAAGTCVALVPALSHYPEEQVRTVELTGEVAQRRVLALWRRDDPNLLISPVLDALKRASQARARRNSSMHV